jgi:peptidoglycan/LPS O-acetylase OafA/YrhL
MAARRRFLELDALRGLAALWVVLFHYTFGVGYFWLNRDFAAARHLTPSIPNLEGLRAVDLFFLVSGFVIFMTIENTASLMDFVVSRVSRLFPAFLFAVVMSSALAVALPLAYQPISLHQFLANLTMLEQYLGQAPVDPVYWSLTFELGFYFCMALVFVCGAMRHIEVIGTIWVLLSFLLLKAFPLIGAHLPWRLQAAIALPYAALFFSGILFYRIRQEGATPKRVALLALCYLEYVAFQDIKFVAIVSGIYLLFALCAAGRAGFLACKPLTFLGSISYALYLVHYSIGFRLQTMNYRVGMPPSVNLLVTVCIAVGAATAVTFLIDRPGHRAINRAYRNWLRDFPWRHGFVVWRRRSISGERVWGSVMLRRVEGRMQYRAASKEDAAEQFELRA